MIHFFFNIMDAILLFFPKLLIEELKCGELRISSLLPFHSLLMGNFLQGTLMLF